MSQAANSCGKWDYTPSPIHVDLELDAVVDILQHELTRSSEKHYGRGVRVIPTIDLELRLSDTCITSSDLLPARDYK